MTLEEFVNANVLKEFQTGRDFESARGFLVIANEFIGMCKKKGMTSIIDDSKYDGAPIACTFDADECTLTTASLIAWKAGDSVRLDTTDTLPDTLMDHYDYFWIPVSATSATNTGRLSTTYASAKGGQHVGFYTDGEGTHSVYKRYIRLSDRADDFPIDEEWADLAAAFFHMRCCPVGDKRKNAFMLEFREAWDIAEQNQFPPNEDADRPEPRRLIGYED